VRSRSQNDSTNIEVPAFVCSALIIELLVQTITVYILEYWGGGTRRGRVFRSAVFSIVVEAYNNANISRLVYAVSFRLRYIVSVVAL